MNRIRFLDIDSLNERLTELSDLRDTHTTAKDELAEAEKALAAYEASPDEDAPDDSGFDELTEAVEDAQSAFDDAEGDFGADEVKELAALESLRDEVGSRGDKISEDGGPFVHEGDFVEYAQELAEDIGAIDPRAGWPLRHIDWDAAAEELRSDYTSVEFEGDTYLYRG